MWLRVEAFHTGCRVACKERRKRARGAFSSHAAGLTAKLHGCSSLAGKGLRLLGGRMEDPKHAASFQKPAVARRRLFGQPVSRPCSRLICMQQGAASPAGGALPAPSSGRLGGPVQTLVWLQPAALQPPPPLLSRPSFKLSSHLFLALSRLDGPRQVHETFMRRVSG